MILPNEKFTASQRSVGTTKENPSVGMLQRDPQRDSLIDRDLQNLQYIGIFALAISAIMVIRVFSPKAEHAILFALSLSAVLIIFLFTV